MVFANIEYLFLLLLLIPYIVWYIMRRKNSEATLQISDARVYAHAPKSYKNYFCLLYTSPSPRDMRRSRMPSSA